MLISVYHEGQYTQPLIGLLKCAFPYFCTYKLSFVTKTHFPNVRKAL